MVIDFLLEDRETLGLEAALTMRVHRKLMKKLNSKHLTNLTDQEKQYYLRTLDVCLLTIISMKHTSEASEWETFMSWMVEFL